MLKKLQTLLAQGETGRVLEILLESNSQSRHYNSLLGTLGRLNRAKKAFNLGTVSKENHNIEVSRINAAVIEMINTIYKGEEKIEININMTNDSLVKRILPLVDKAKRRNIALHSVGAKLRDDILAYEAKKVTDKSFDLTNRRLKVLQNRVSEYIKLFEEASDTNIEDFVTQIGELLSANIPTWDDIKKAHTLCKERGLRSAFIEQELRELSDSEELRIQCAEEMENFLSTLQK